MCEEDDSKQMVESPSVIVRDNWRIVQLLDSYDPITVASTLCRILRKHGPLIPTRLHYLFSQLSVPTSDEIDIGLPARQFASGSSTYKNQCRALRFLLQLTPSRHLSLIYRPLFHLLALITTEPICEVNEQSICVLFAPILLMDRETSNPAELANPQIQQAVHLMLSLAKCDMPLLKETTTTYFKLPRQFLDDCQSNIQAHLVSEVRRMGD